MQKKQNTRRSIDESILKIYAAGIYVLAGFIVGFDTERESMADAMTSLIEATSIPICTVGLLTALPNTQLTRRLEKEGRLYQNFDLVPEQGGDAATGGLNFKTLRPRREILEDFRSVVERIYEPKAFFARLTHVAKVLRKAPIQRGPSDPVQMGKELALVRNLLLRVCLRQPSLAIPLWRILSWTLENNPAALEPVIMNIMMYMHVRPFSLYVVKTITRKIEAIDREPEPMVRVPEPARVAA